MAAATPPTVAFCERSTIAEAWATIFGLPGPLDETDAPVLGRAARQAIPDIVQIPAIVTMSAPKDGAPPFWRQQVAWDDGRHVARFGHRYLSVHFVRQEEAQRYVTFEESLEPALKTWLRVYNDALADSATVHQVDRIAFGYTNSFEFPAAVDFDLSRHFRLNLAIDVGEPNAGLLGLQTEFRFYDPHRDVYQIVALTAETQPNRPESIAITTKVTAERRGLENIAYSDADQILDNVNSIREAAKRLFFGFATQQTHEYMGARYAANDAR